MRSNRVRVYKYRFSCQQRDEYSLPISVTRVLIDPFFVNNGLRTARNGEIDTFNQGECRDATARKLIKSRRIRRLVPSDGQMSAARAHSYPSRASQIHHL